MSIFAVLFGLIGAYGMRKYLQSEKPAPPPPPAAPRMTAVPLASMDLEAGRPLVLGDIGIHRMTDEEIAKRRKEGKLPAVYMSNPEQIMGRMLKVPMKQGEAFQTDMFYPDGTGPTIAEKLAPGLRAVTISVDGTGALGGYDGPGSYVDVLFRTKPDDDAGVPETTVTLLEGVQVLAMEQEAARMPPGPSLQNRVTLAVTAVQANALKIVEGRGTFSLSLRNPEDVEIADAALPQTLDGLLNLPVRQEFTTAIYRAGASSAVSFPGAAATPQPAVALPVAGVLQMRAEDKLTALEKEGAEQEKETAPSGSGGPKTSAPAPAAPEPPSATPKKAAKSSPSGQLKAEGDQAERTGPPDSGATVTLRIPVSVLIGERQFQADAAIVPAAGRAESPPAPPAPAAAKADAVTNRDATPESRSAGRKKMLSDIGRRFWEQQESDFPK